MKTTYEIPTIDIILLGTDDIMTDSSEEEYVPGEDDLPIA